MQDLESFQFSERKRNPIPKAPAPPKPKANRRKSCHKPVKIPNLRHHGIDLSSTQVRVLQVLADAKGPIAIEKISERTGNANRVCCYRAIGSPDAEQRAAYLLTPTAKHTGIPLLDRDYVSFSSLHDNGRTYVVYLITDRGRTALAQVVAKVGRIPMLANRTEE